jgi:menaquinone-dependent protoporphyrinogen oxidase
MKVLVAAASKHGSTAEIARSIAESLSQSGLDTTLLEPEAVAETDGFDAFVLGSAVYAGHWMRSAKALASSLSDRRADQPLWLFSSGPVGDPPKPAEDPVDISDILASTGAIEHRVFSGCIDTSRLGLGERGIVAALRVPVGDDRDWADIQTWAGSIAESLRGASYARPAVHA